ncbi:ankyrin repeat-containing domain protein [Pelagophyceae sp. CCMP2097]|nr:ankyrin repeat-containing domain protein [Pelagophyceae sp. CCMP2097]
MRAAAAWECHVCSKMNEDRISACVVCGRSRARRCTRPGDRGAAAQPLLFAETVRAMRPEQIEAFLDDEYASLGQPLRADIPKRIQSLPKGEYSRAVRLLVLAGPGGPVNAADDQGYTSVHVASSVGNVQVLQVLLDSGGLTDVETKEQGWRPLHLAAMAGSLGCAQVLLHHGAQVQPSTPHLKTTPLHCCVCPRIASLLLDRGADAASRDVSGRTPMHHAAVRNDVDVASEMHKVIGYERGVLAQDLDHWSPEQLAELYGHQAFVHFCRVSESVFRHKLLEQLPPRAWHSEVWSAAVRSYDRVERERNAATRRLEIVANEKAQIDALRTNLALEAHSRQNVAFQMGDVAWLPHVPRGTEARMPPTAKYKIFDEYIGNVQTIEASNLMNKQGVYARTYAAKTPHGGS